MITYVKNTLSNGIIKNIISNFLMYIIKSTPIFISLCIIISVAQLLGIRVFSEISGETFNKFNIFHLIFWDAYSFLCLLVLPLLLNKYFFKMSLKDLGLKFPLNVKIAVAYVCLLLLITLPLLKYIYMHDAQMRVAYAISGSSSLVFMIFLQFFILPFYYFCEELFFRGFYFMYLWRRIGWHSYWITEITFMFAHAGKPMTEIWISFPVGILLNILTLRTKSIYPAVMVHTCMGITMNMLGWYS